MPKVIEFGWESRRVIAKTGQTSHQHTEIEINYVEQGALTYHYGTQDIHLAAGSVAVFWAAIPHQIMTIYSAPVLHWLTLPFAVFLAWRLPPGFVEQLVSGYMVTSTDDSLASRSRLYFDSWHDELHSQASDAQKIVKLEVEAYISRIANTNPVKIQADIEDTGFNKARYMAKFIAQHYTELLSIDQIARFVNLHPNYAMSLFRQHYDMSLLDYVTQFRVAHAQRLLLLSNHSIQDIAIASGFGSVSQFYAVFGRTFGVPPRRYRSLK